MADPYTLVVRVTVARAVLLESDRVLEAANMVAQEAYDMAHEAFLEKSKEVRNAPLAGH